MESARSATYHQRADAQLHALARALNLYEGFGCSFRDNALHVIRFGAEPGNETVTCAPRPSDQDRLWFWASDRTPIGEADKIQDSALALSARMPQKRP
jgi:hypothetical protein